MFVNSYFQIATFFIFYDEIHIFNNIYLTERKIEYLSLLIFYEIFVKEFARAYAKGGDWPNRPFRKFIICG